MPRDYDVFISYNWEDKEEAQSLNRLLVEQFGLSTWFDEQNMKAGDQIVQSIEKGLSQSFKCLILIGSSGQGPWQIHEVYAALQQQMEKTYFRVIPVLLPTATTEPNWPLFLRGKLWIDLRKNYFEGLRKLLHAIRGKSQVALYRQHGSFGDSYPDIRSDEETLPAGHTADVSKIVELLIGESLYSRKDVCVRELIQNAVDACQRRKARIMSAYEPKVFLRINTTGRWFEVDDNGEGMNPELFRTSFSVIGKSIRDEEGLMQLISEKRAYVIATFGIGFISTFMVSNKITVSTTFEGEDQINASIKAFDERFSYTDSSECSRDPERIGTTVRVYLSDEQFELDVLGSAIRYLRHVPYCHISKDGKEIEPNDDWNVGAAVKSEVVKSRSGSYELRWGASPNEGAFVASNWGFLIGEHVNPILPFYTPSWMTGEIYLLPGVVDLNVARDAIITNQKSLKIKQDIHRHLRSFIYDLVGVIEAAEQERASAELPRKANKSLAAKSVPGGTALKDTLTKDENIIKEKLKDLFMAYNYCARRPNTYADITSEEVPLSLEETNELILDMLKFEYGPDKNLMTLRKIIDNLHDLKITKAYYSYERDIGFLPFLVKLLSGKGYLVFDFARIKVLFRGSTRGPFDTWNTEILDPIFMEHGIELQDITQVEPEELDLLRVMIDDLPARIATVLHDEVNRGVRLSCINLPEAELIFQRSGVRYLNTAHETFMEFIQWAGSVSDHELEVFVSGLLQKVP